MNILQAIILGTVQGLTEFLPVSSSGHLVIVQSIFKNFDQPGVLFDALLHLATAFAILIYFREKILKLEKKLIYLILIGSIPAGIVGIFFDSFIESLFASTLVVGIALLITAAFNFATDRAYARREKVEGIDAIIIGIAQAIAIIPGISRSGSTIFAATSLGIKRQDAAEFSFLLSIPAILGASFLQFIKHGTNSDLSIFVYLTGMVAAFLTALGAIYIVLSILTQKRFVIFSVYCVIVGIISIFIL